VHDWRADSHKTVLNYGWIQACLRTGRALLEADEWGGFRVLHTSGCAYSDEDADEGSGDVQGGTRLVLRYLSLSLTYSQSSSPASDPLLIREQFLQLPLLIAVKLQ
jgi:hypothetical protein